SNASWNRQCECTSTVLLRLPLTITGRSRGWPCARAASSRPQLQKATPEAPTPLRKFLRVVMYFSRSVSRFGRSIDGLFLISSSGRLPSPGREGNDSRKYKLRSASVRAQGEQYAPAQPVRLRSCALRHDRCDGA